MHSGSASGHADGILPARLPVPGGPSATAMPAQNDEHPHDGEVTLALQALRGGDDGAIDRIFPLVYAELRRTADILLGREFEAHTLQPTALVNEVYLKLARGGNPDATSRAHFLGIAARAMRQILVDHARRRKAAKRGKGEVFVTLGDHEDVASPDAESMIALDDAMTRLATLDARLAKVVELRFFGGLTEDQVAATLGVTTRTVQRDWAKARAWLHTQIAADA
jgi:RNA polymerase sigma factor (TIGR02999 family)